ncbi:aldo/keto reductase [Rugosimonospora acidiphila]|uniref:Aldo/keto reductase n=1 Tax=Rugosimonospora acidiphila TaxID=556531 RepID=A0ABP9SRB2_9ACTN
MRTRRLGSSGLRVTALGIGTASFGSDGTDEAVAFEILDRAFAAGIRLIDTADSYPSLPDRLGAAERIVGRWVASRDVRDEVVIATKVNYPMTRSLNSGGLGRGHILRAVDDSLDRLQTDHIDLLQAHQVDRGTPVLETVRAFDSVVQRGAVHYYGVCNWPAWLIAKACALADHWGLHRPISAQLKYSPVMRDVEREVVPLCLDEGIGLLTINALAGGLLTGRYRYEDGPNSGRFGSVKVGSSGRSMGEIYTSRYWSPEHFAAVDALRKACPTGTAEMVATVIAWVASRPAVGSVLLGASKPEQLSAQLDGAARSLDPETARLIDELWWGIPRKFV